MFFLIDGVSVPLAGAPGKQFLSKPRLTCGTAHRAEIYHHIISNLACFFASFRTHYVIVSLGHQFQQNSDSGGINEGAFQSV
jgi:hypothetical protein